MEERIKRTRKFGGFLPSFLFYPSDIYRFPFFLLIKSKGRKGSGEKGRKKKGGGK